ncbi:hypothetical protein BAE44_0008674 [Dichanthelium oligosanthes]|uniref:DUF7595 domain-containing protein n=1 Tax=Dichanthelium oligosanthes TaxID=888268 RepID=A0A1E5VYW8_9POAL|nr:hypothetical protein BAE44_0008674 [Dichanthelium oligosanthes]
MPSRRCPRRTRSHGVGLLAAVHAGYDPAALLGVSYASPDDNDIVRASWRLRFDTGLLRSFELVSSCAGLLVLWRHEAKAEPELRVCNTFTGHVACLPYMDEDDGKGGNAGIYRPALLSVDDAGRSFELLVMDGCLRTCIFSSKGGNGKCGAIRLVKPPPEDNSWCFVNQTVHADEAQATAVEPPQGYLGSIGNCSLATTADGKLSMFVREPEVISMWTLSAEGCSREAVISKQGINQQVILAWTRARRSAGAWGSGRGAGPCPLGWTKKASVLRLGAEHGTTGGVAP